VGHGGAESIVAENRTRQAVFAERIPQHIPGGSHGDIHAGAEGEEKARMVINDGEGGDAPASDLERPLEIALPEVVGFRTFKKLNRRGRCWGE